MKPDKELAQMAGDLLKNAGLRLAIAESCTGGLLGSALTNIPGSSDYLLGGVIAYDDTVKTALLGVDPAVIVEYGAVSAECALLMARGVVRVIGGQVSISITGIAGPTGGTATKPVGTTYIALVAPGVERVEHFCWSGARVSNKQRSVQAALSMLVDYLSQPGAGVPPELATLERGA